MKKIKVLVVDDSLVFRYILSKGLSDDTIEVVATAADAFDARDKIIQYKPDVMTCDVEMPKMNGIEFIKRLLPQYPIPIIVVSTISGAVFDAMNAGAVDFVTKPECFNNSSTYSFLSELKNKIKTASISKVITNLIKGANSKPAAKSKSNVSVIAVGTSTGGPEAIYNLLSNLPHDIPGILIAQHMPSTYTQMFADRLNSQFKFDIKEAETGDIVTYGKVFIAPGNKNMTVENIGGKLSINCATGDDENSIYPSADDLFESVARQAKSHAIGIILTGMGSDGAKGLLSMRNSGAYTIGQDEKSSVVYGMPGAAFNSGAVIKQASLADMPKLIVNVVNGKRN